MTAPLDPKPPTDYDPNPAPEIEVARKPTWKSLRFMIPAWAVIAGLVWASIHFGWHRGATASGLLIFGVLSNAFAWVLGLIALVPLIGPLIVKVVTMGFVMILNAVGYFVSIVAIKKGFTKEVLHYRVLTITLLIGILVGYIIGKLF